MVKVFVSLILIGIAVSCQATPCPPGQHLYEPDGKCYAEGVGSGTPCTSDLKFYSQKEEKSDYGSCNCLHSVGNANRPVVQWQENNQCFMIFDQGPCNKGEWLILGKSGKRECAKRTCPDDEGKNGDNFWFEHNGKCLQVEASSLEFCGNERDRIVFDSETYEPFCMEAIPKGRGLGLSPGQYIRCPPGYKQLMNGQCVRITNFGGPFG